MTLQLTVSRAPTRTDSSVRRPHEYSRNFPDDTSIGRQGFVCPASFRGRLKIDAVDFSLENVDGWDGFWARSELSGGKFVHQSKRSRFGLSASPTLFALFPGFGPGIAIPALDNAADQFQLRPSR